MNQSFTAGIATHMAEYFREKLPWENWPADVNISPKETHWLMLPADQKMMWHFACYHYFWSFSVLLKTNYQKLR